MRRQCEDSRGVEGWTCEKYDGTGLWCDACLENSRLRGEQQVSEQEKTARYVCGHGCSFAVACADCDAEVWRDLHPAAPEPQTAPETEQMPGWIVLDEVAEVPDELWNKQPHLCQAVFCLRQSEERIATLEKALREIENRTASRTADRLAIEVYSIARAALSGERPAPEEGQ